MKRATGQGAQQARNGPDLAKLAVVYPRQSTQEQVRENVQSTARQLALREQAIAHGFAPERVLVVVDDLGLSGRTIAGRPGFSRILAMMRDGLVGALYVEDLTRLSRDDRTVDQMVIASECEAAGVPLWMGGTWYDLTESGSRQAFKYQAVGFSETWRAHLGKLHAAQMNKAAKGRLAGGKVRRGYAPKRDVPKNHPERDRLVVVPDEAAIVLAIAHAMIAHGSIRKAYRATYPIHWPDGALVTGPAFSDVASHPIYRGAYAYAGHLVPEAHEAIIPPELAAELDAMREANKAALRRPTAANAPGGALAGLLTCTTCGGKGHSSTARGARIYECRPSQRNHGMAALESPHPCRWQLQAAPLDALVLDALMRQLAGGLAARVVANIGAERSLQAAKVNLGEATRRTLARKVAGLVATLADPELSPEARRPLLQALTEAQRELEAFEAAATMGQPRLGADGAFFAQLAQDLAASPEAVASLAATWGDEVVGWRRRWLRRFVLGAALTCTSPGRFRLDVVWRDGGAEGLALTTRAGVTAEELAIAKAALASPNRPKQGRGEWLRQALAAAGFERSLGGALRIGRLAQGLPEGGQTEA